LKVLKTPSPPTPPPPEEGPTAEMFTVKQLYNLFSQVRLSSTIFVYKIKLFLFQKMFEIPSLHYHFNIYTYCEITFIRGVPIFVVFVARLIHEIKNPTNNETGEAV
jgi:hypothetical protein